MTGELKISIIAGLLTLLIGCSTVENFDEFINRWIGADSSQLLSGGWREDLQGETLLPNGNVEYIFDITKRYNLTLPDACVIYFEVDSQTKKIVRIRHEGNRCKRAPSFV